MAETKRKEDVVGALPIGTILHGQHQYRIVRVLGQGGYGITYLATARVPVYGGKTMDLRFAIKEHFDQQLNYRVGTTATIPNPTKEDEVRDSIRDFQKEARRMNSLNHPNIVKVYENFEENNTAYYVMQYVEGGNLRTKVKNSRNGRLTEKDAMSILIGVAKALDYLHNNRILHLDVKPDNIVLVNGQPMLIDFGLAKASDGKGGLTKTNKAAGHTDGYAPIEQYSGIERFIPEADVYALAATLLFMLTGRNPRKAGEISERVIENSLNGLCGQKVCSAIIHAMEQFKEYRTKSVRLFIEEAGWFDDIVEKKIEPLPRGHVLNRSYISSKIYKEYKIDEPIVYDENYIKYKASHIEFWMTDNDPIDGDGDLYNFNYVYIYEFLPFQERVEKYDFDSDAINFGRNYEDISKRIQLLGKEIEKNEHVIDTFMQHNTTYFVVEMDNKPQNNINNEKELKTDQIHNPLQDNSLEKQKRKRPLKKKVKRYGESFSVILGVVLMLFAAIFAIYVIYVALSSQISGDFFIKHRGVTFFCVLLIASIIYRLVKGSND